MTELFNRDFEAIIGTQKIKMQTLDPLRQKISPGLKVTFTVEKSGNRDPNRAEIEIYNLNEANRRILQTGADLAEKSKKAKLVYDWPLILKAGYADSKEQIFSGDIITASSRLDGTDWITSIEAEDGGNAYRSKRIKQSFGKGTPVQVVLTALAKALEVGLGNSALQFAAGAQRTGYLKFNHGVALSGRVSALLDKYVTSAGYHWSIQDGQLQILAPDKTLLDSIVVLTKDTGLIGSPERGEKGIVKVRSLLQPSIKPGRIVQLVSTLLTGRYKATKVAHFGDTWGADWYTEFEGKPLS